GQVLYVQLSVEEGNGKPPHHHPSSHFPSLDDTGVSPLSVITDLPYGRALIIIINEKREMLLEFGDAMQLVILNTWFQKDKSRLVTFESAGNRTVVDYVLVRKCDRTLVTNVKVAQNEECIPQHKLIVRNVVMRESLKEKKAAFVSKCKVWKLRDADVGKRFQEKVTSIAAARIKGTVESEWNSMKD